ncbi:Hypothetical protein LBF_0511 [Leptospira biflexa serovar Patoc strain 'Patoc 1 (Ames)']|uniref:Uncharacterized protein n=1 Tax=Leptospira biflexa serovar Patoc (strain Patoc 1 / ATCC 23582 / Paris) TaxID=456481 RepID=B0SJG8_LEPBP|nr:hypothetical protein [Leptospira biflexa]ABZ93049.1 Hypothetical protein LBF_0511 [Leptospira biflexa serovar Patoc strain 'Patoc 1 (Ames)']ABZ96668.1 Conserved hypothetical protein [Leptospira biflexa serovar Patoc strain 'Patoc 1 (Paris)']
MAIYSRYEPHRKKKSKAPLFLLVLALGLSALGFTYRKEIYFLFAKDQSVRAEKTKEKTIELWKSGNLKEKDIEDFQSIATTYSEKDPTDPVAFHLIARSLFWNLNRLGIQFEHDSLILHLGSSFREFIGSSVLAASTLDSIFWNARTAEAFSSSPFSDWENNRVLLFLGETHRGVKRPQVLVGEYGNLDRSKLSSELQSVYVWLLTFNTMLAGDAAGLDHLITITKDPNYKIGIHFSPREENFLRGLGKYYKKDYVGALSLLRQAKTNNPDRITETSIITEATIFHLQNLSQKGIDLLEDFYVSNGKKNTAIPILIASFIKEKPGLKTKLDLSLDPKE